ncbi:hypothetical protein B566_EDAN012936 [Ephemera danica]|nr:hypothetical protein B566_EDAN012936 [Ephemera danica]
MTGEELENTFMVYTDMERLLDKLQLLNYDKEFVHDLKMKPLTRHYFAEQTNPGEQFYAFTSLSAWLIRKIGKKFEQPQEFDDPNATISKILDCLRTIGATIDFPPSKLKQGCGEYAVFVLDQLADHALNVSRFSWRKPEPPEEPDVEEEVAEDESELLLEQVEEQMALSDDEPEDNLLNVDDLQQSTKFIVDSQKENILESKTDLESWKLELERVLPQLKVTVKADTRDWRSHLEQMQQLQKGITTAFESTSSELESLHTDVAKALDKIGAREKYLNSQLEPMLVEFRKVQAELARTKEHYKEVSGGVQLGVSFAIYLFDVVAKERSRTLGMISDELDLVKQEMEERGVSMTDGTPLVNLKKTLAKLQAEINVMDVRIGALDSELMHARLREKALLQQEIGAESI